MANCVAVGVFTDVEEFEAIGALASKIREAIRHDELGFGARNSYEEDAQLFVETVAGLVDVFHVLWQRETIAITAGVAPVFIIGGDQEDVFVFETLGRVDGL